MSSLAPCVVLLSQTIQLQTAPFPGPWTDRELRSEVHDNAGVQKDWMEWVTDYFGSWKSALSNLTIGALVCVLMVCFFICCLLPIIRAIINHIIGNQVVMAVGINMEPAPAEPVLEEDMELGIELQFLAEQMDI